MGYIQRNPAGFQVAKLGLKRLGKRGAQPAGKSFPGLESTHKDSHHSNRAD
jgi:hypothetical protein